MTASPRSGAGWKADLSLRVKIDPCALAGRRRMPLRDWHAARIAPGNVARDRPSRPRSRTGSETLEADKERVRQLLARYGVLFRELLRARRRCSNGASPAGAAADGTVGRGACRPILC